MTTKTRPQVPSAPAMATTPCPVGATPKAYDGKASSAIAFWNTLKNYYMINTAVYADEKARIQSALTHFKLGTQAGEWASDRIAKALSASPVNYGTWAEFKKDFNTQFIPPQTQVDAIAKMHSLRMGNREFNDWFQEWSAHCHRANVDEGTKMYAFCHALNQALNQKLVNITPQPTTLDALVEKARDLDRNWQIYAAPLPDRSKRTPHCNSNARVCEISGEEASNAEIMATQNQGKFRKKGRLTPAEHKHRMDNNLCLYCSKPGHRAIACTEPPNKRPETRLRQVETISEEGINNTDLLEESGVNQLSTNYYTPLMGTEDSEDALMSSF